MSIHLPDDTQNQGKYIDTTLHVVGGLNVEREVVRVGGGAAAEVADVRNIQPGPTDLGVVVRSMQFPAALSTDGNQKVSIEEDGGGLLGAKNETIPATDTATAGLNARLQRIAKNVTDLRGQFPAALTGNGNLKVCISEDLVGSTVQTDAATQAGGQQFLPLVLSFPLKWDGSQWVRGGYTAYCRVSTADNNATFLKASAGTVCFISASNTNAAARYLVIYNKASAPSPAADSALIAHKFLIPGGGSAGSGTNIPLPPEGIALSSGIAFAIVAGAAANDNTSVASAEIIVNIGYR